MCPKFTFYIHQTKANVHCTVHEMCITEVIKTAAYVLQARVLEKTTVRNCIIESVWNIFGLGQCSLFMGRLDCRFSTSVFIVKRWQKTLDYLTRNNLDLSTPPFYSSKRRKKAGFRTQSHSTDNKNTCTYTPRQSREYGTKNGRK